MAILNNIRKRGIFLIIVIALALFSFILADLIREGGFSQRNANTLGVINGDKISHTEFSNRLQNAQQNAPEDYTTVQAVNQVWDAMIEQALIEEQIEKLGIEAGSEQIKTTLAQQFGQNPEFLTNGQFDVNKLKGYINQLRATSPEAYQQWLANEEQMVEQAKIGIYFDLLGAGLGVTKTDAKELYKINNQSFDLEYTRIPYSSLDDEEFEVTDDEIKEYINKHKEEFKSKGARDIRYVFFEEKASSDDEDAIKEELNKLLEDHTTYNKAADMEETIDGFKNTEDYSAYLSEHSDLPYEDYYHFKKDLPEAYADTLFSLKKGEGFGPYKDDGYWKYSKLVDERETPDSVKVKHILIAHQDVQGGEDLDRTKEEAKQIADSLLTIVKDDSGKFSELATENSDDQSSGQNGGEIGWLTPQNEETNPFFEFAFENEPESSEVVETEFGYHVAYIEDVKNKQKTIKLATLGLEIEPSDQTLNDLFNDASKFQIAAKEGDFSDEAKSKSYEVRTVKNLEPMDENISGIGNQRNIVKWAFEDAKPGDITRLELNDGYVVVQLTSSITEGTQSVEEAKDKVKPILLKQKKGDYLKKNIKGDDLAKIASEHNTEKKTKNGVTFGEPDLEGFEPEVVGRAFSLEEGEVSEPIAGDQAAYVIKLIKKSSPDKPDSYDEIIFQEDEKIRQHTAQELMDVLEEKADIEDYRFDFY